jgi:biotin carboxyl carrier protein
MKYTLKVDGKSYTVEVGDLNARPVIARVDGVEFEVVPEGGAAEATGRPSDPKPERSGSPPASPRPSTSPSISPNPAISGNALIAPLPGTVVEVFVKAGERVESGQVVVIIEAMKMKNSIRSVYSGTVSEVLVAAGQSVAHKQALIKFADLGEAAWI